jgi:peroxiredoxin
MLGRVSVGDAAPTFELEGSRGRPVKLTSLRGNWLVLAFSDRWQPLGPMVEIEDEMRRLGAEIVGVCHEKSRTLSAAQQRDSISFLLLSDLTGQVSATFGLYNEERSETLPGFLVIDRRGVVKMMVQGPLPPSDTIARIARFAITGL